MIKEEVFKIKTAEDRIMLPHRVMYMLEELNYYVGIDATPSIKIKIEVSE